MNFDKTSYRLFRQQLGEEIFQTPAISTPHCVALSGGLDSSAILALFHRTCKNLRSYSIGFNDSNEFEAASRVAKHFKVKHTNITVTKRNYVDACKEIINLKGAPLQVPNEALLYLIAKRFKQDIGDKVGVFLSGEGGDELFGGYTNILDTVPYKSGDLIKNYVTRELYDLELWETLSKKEKERYLRIYQQVLKQCHSEDRYDQVQHLLVSLHYPALIQRLRTVELVDEIVLHLPFTERAWLQIYQVLPKEFRTNKTFLRLVFGRVLPKEVLDAEKIGFPLPINLKKWQKWNLEVWRKGKSKINFWRK